MLGFGAALAAEPTLSVPEQREILEALQELEAARVEIAEYKALVATDEKTIGKLQEQVDALQRLTEAQDKLITAATKVVPLLERAVERYEKLAAMADTRADENLKRAERAEAWVWRGTILGFVLGFGTGVAAVLAW